MTIPPLVSKYEKHVIEVGLKKTYADLYNVIKRAEIDNGPYTEWDYSDGNKFINAYIAPYMHLNKCNKRCFSGKGAGSDGKWIEYNGYLSGSSSPKFLLDDGRSIDIYVLYNYVSGAYNRGWVAFTVDVNGHRGKSVAGIDVFQFGLANLGHYQKNGFYLGHPVNGGQWMWSTERLKEDCPRSFNIGCGILLQRNGWRFPDDYPIKF